MARPQKDGLEYYSHDVDMSSDPKVEYLEAIHGLIGYAVLHKILEKVYRNSYYIDFGDKEELLFSKRISINKDKLHNIVNTCLSDDCQIFDKSMYDKYKILTSLGIQKRYLFVTKKRIQTEINPQYKLLKNSISSPETGIKGEETMPEPIVSDEISTQSIVKYSKEKKRMFEDDSVEIKASKYLFSKILENDPKAKQPDFQKWAESIDGLIRLDKRSKDEIRKVIDWIQTYKSGNFTWKANILSTKKLRQHFPTMILQMNEVKGSVPTKPDKPMARKPNLCIDCHKPTPEADGIVCKKCKKKRQDADDEAYRKAHPNETSEEARKEIDKQFPVATIS